MSVQKNTFRLIFLFSSVYLYAFCFTPKDDFENSYLALGDSYTICESIDESKQWPKLLAQELSKKGLSIEKPKIIAKTGWRTDDMLRAAKIELTTKKYDLVSLLIGVNNEFQRQSAESFEPQFKKCLSYAISHSVSGVEGVFVLSIPDYGYSSFGEKNKNKISTRIDAFNEVCKRVCKEYKVKFFNITPISRKGLKDHTYVAQDGLHPSAKQYLLWVKQFADEVHRMLVK